MPEPFKNLFNKKVITAMGEEFSKAWPDFDGDGFISSASRNLGKLELKARSAQITAALVDYLPEDFDKAADIMLASLAPDIEAPSSGDADTPSGISGWAIMPMAEYVGVHGLAHFDISMNLFREMTKRFSAEFGIRFFLIEEPKRTLRVLQEWTSDANHHVRRLVSEGTRPRLPWAMRMPAFIEEPALILPLLESLKDDDEEYVRRSVANNLNDIAKDHPDIVARIAAQWLKGASKNRKKLIRHACRTLVKQGHRETLKALGYGPPSVRLENLKVLTPQVIFGGALEFDFSMASTATRTQSLIIDYAIHHRKANGSTSPKVFKWKTTTLMPTNTLSAKRKHPMRKITTRIYYPGTHRLEVLVNGVPIGITDFELLMPASSSD
jgi:3-methyladenine DNA glycosylase AlkC